MPSLLIGVDVGTGGARVLAATPEGEVVATAEAPIASSQKDGARHEQDPESWWSAVRQALGSVVHEVDGRKTVRAICVDGTSATLVGLDRASRPTTPGLMYDDGRAAEEAAELGVNASFSIARMRWLERHEPERFARTHVFVHQSDHVAARLAGKCGVTDSSNALKAGYDLALDAWPAWIEEHPDLRARLPRVVRPGSSLGAVDAAVAADLGLGPGVEVVAGVSDGTAAFLASGASRIGDTNTTLGTTLVFKRLAAEEVRDPDGLVYCHRLGETWLPGAASNTGADWIRRDFAGADLTALDIAASELLPAEHLFYPLCAHGERFPFACPEARGFCEPAVSDPVQRFAAGLQGTALLERLGYEVLDEKTSTRPGADVYATGGGSRSDVWTQLRADVTGRVYLRPYRAESAFGAAILAAAATVHGDLWTAAREMVRIERSFQPDASRHAVFDEYHLRFRRLLAERGYMEMTTR